MKKTAPDTAILAGSARLRPRGCKLLGAAPPQERMQVTVRIRAREAAQSLSQHVGALALQAPRQRQYLSREEFLGRFGADAADVAMVEAFAHEHGLTVVRVDIAARSLRLEGSVAQFSSAFGVKLRRARLERGTLKPGIYRTRSGDIRIPSGLQGIIVGVHGLDNRPVARPHFRLRRKAAAGATARAAAASFTAPQLAALYDFPGGLTGAGQCVAIIELNDADSSGKPTGTGYRTSDLLAYFKKLAIPMPAVTAIGVDGGANLPGKSQADGEVVLDIEVAGSIAPGAAIAVYFAPNTTSGFIDAVKSAVHDSVRKPSVVSISWGGPEDPNGQLATQFLDALNEALQEAAAMGVTVCVAAGDNGSADMSSDWDGKPHADFPASSPYALACGGTTLVAAGGRISAESVWNDGQSGGATGGGVSDYFARPSYQGAVSVPLSPTGFKGRGLPDLAGDADPNSGYQIYLDSQWQVIGGTSAVAPLTAGLLALINQQLQQKFSKTAGQINPQIYARAAAGTFRDITVGNNDIEGNLNGEYSALTGWDACSGFGVPDGARLLQLLSA
ncbi:MAG TPA: S53 family peptidase [Steroidobacteraceae bacterium]|jgi:kumamolisin|nr:S53 family peptidase [Steroidobacteraceae bacterium]